MSSTIHPDNELRGRRIAITRTGEQAASLIDQLRAHGADPIVCSAIAIVPPESYDAVDAALRAVAQYDWILFTSVNAVTAFLDRSALLGVPMEVLGRIRMGAVGRTTADALEARGLTPVVVPKAFIARSLIDALGSRVVGRKILLPRANIAKSDLPMELRKNGALVDDVVVYRTEPGPGITDLVSRLRAHTLDAITFASSSAVRYFVDGAHTSEPAEPSWLEQMWTHPDRPAIFCIGPVTADTARILGVPVDAVADEYDADGLMAAIRTWFAARQSPLRN